jgi:hypothetical protein
VEEACSIEVFIPIYCTVTLCHNPEEKCGRCEIDLFRPGYYTVADSCECGINILQKKLGISCPDE